MDGYEIRDGLAFGRPVALVPIKVQGITIRPGDPILVNIEGEWVRRTYAGQVEDGGAWIEFDPNSTRPQNDPGPFPLEALRHPNFLEGMIKEIDAPE